ncbi:MAG: AraC family transcriptional regulator [Bacteroidaceae bacterium]|nr:AraC family transcriptional regulator [Bacteroidaceae bacterium]
MELEKPYIYHNVKADGVQPHNYLGTMVHLLCKSGSMSFYFAGQKVVATPGSLVIWQMRSNIQQVQYSDDFDADFFIISKAFMLQFNPEAEWTALGFTYIKMHPVFPLRKDELEIMKQDFQDMGRRMRGQHQFQTWVVRHQLQLFMLDMWSIYSREIHKLSLNKAANHHFNKFLELVQEHCKENRTVSFYSDKLCISSPYLLQVCQQVSSCSASDWIAYYTLQEIVTLLNNPDYSISQISDLLHFSTPSFFSHYVKKHLGISPAEFRK